MKGVARRVNGKGLWLLVLAVAASGCGKTEVGEVRPQPVTVQIVSEPAGAMVFIDNKYAGLTPYTARDLSAGAHALKVQKSGYKPHAEVLDTAQTGRQVKIVLASLASGKIIVASLPSDARVSIDGRYVGYAPVTVANLAPREYQVRVVAEDYEAWISAVVVKDATPVEVKAVLTSKYEKYFQGAIATAPDDIFNYTELARHYLVKKDFDAAMDMYKKALALSVAAGADQRASQRLLSEVAKAYVGWFTDSTEEDLQKLRPKIIAVFSAQGDVTNFFRQVRAWDRQAKGQDFMRGEKPNVDTIKFLETAIRNDPANVDMRLALGQLYMAERDYTKAQQVYDEVLKANPKNFAAHRQLSDLYRRLGRYDDSQRELELAADCCNDPVWKPELHEKLASVYQARQRQPEAVAQWEKAIASTQDPEDACRRRLRLALLFQKMDEKEKALKLYQEIVDMSKNPGLRNYAQYFLKRAQK